MPIVDFEQDPEAPLGTGNFRDDKGRQMYLSDPDTASQFVKTMRGAPLKRKGPDLRLAENDAGYKGDNTRSDLMQRGPATGGVQNLVMRNTDDPGSIEPLGAGASLVQRQTDAVNKLAGVTATPAAPAAPAPAAPAPAAPAGTPTPPAPSPGSADAAQAPPAAPTTTGGTGAGASLVQRHNDAVNKLAGARTKKGPEPLPMEVSTNNLPPFRTGIGETVNVTEGRPIENIVEGLEETEGAARQTDAAIEQSFTAREQASNQSFETRKAAIQRDNETQKKRQAEARAERFQAEQEQEKLRRALAENDNKLDPDRVMRNMSTGKTIGMIILAALNGGFGAVIGKKDNDVLNVMQNAIDVDIERQKDEIKSGHVRTQNLIDKFMKQGFDAKTAEMLARDQLDKNILAYGDLEAQRIAASADLRAQKDMLLAQRNEALIIRRDQKLQEGEDKITRARQSEESWGVPPVVPGATPQSQLAEIGVQNAKVEQENAKRVEAAVGHPVSPDEAKEIRQDAQDYGKRLAAIARTRAVVRQLGDALKLKRDKDTWTGEPEAGSRPLGVDGLRNEQARRIDRLYSIVARADTEQMTREPSAALQNRFAEITNRPFWDSDIPTQLNDIESVLDQAEIELRNGYDEDVVNFYARRGKTAPRAAGAKPPPAPASGGTKKEIADDAAEKTGGENIGTAPVPKAPDAQKKVDARWE
jgi:hypothetical protein